MICMPITTALAIWAAHHSATNNLSELLSTFTGVAAIISMLIVALIWQLFDRHVAEALQALARQMQTALYADTDMLQDTEPFKYLSPVTDAANDILKAHHTLQVKLKADLDKPDQTLSDKADQLACVIQCMDVGVLVLNKHLQILLYNEQVSHVLGTAQLIGLARPAYSLFKGKQLETQVSLLSSSGKDNLERLSMSLQSSADGKALRAKLRRISGNDQQPIGYVLLIDEAEKKPDALNPRELEQSVSSVLLQTNHPDMRSSLDDDKSTPIPPNPSTTEFYDFELFKRKPGPDILNQQLSENDYTVFDTETTGLKPSEGDEIISIAAIRIVNGRVLQREIFNEFVNPGRKVPARSTVFHGITDEMLEGKPDIESVLPSFAEFVGDSILIAHNAAFDMKFLQMKQDSSNVTIKNAVLDTVLLSAWLHDHTHKHTLDDLAARYNLNIPDRHTALGDSIVTAHIFCRMIEQLAARKVYTVAEALEISSKVTHIKKQQRAY